MLTDIHAHLHIKEYDSDRELVIERAQKAGVSRIINVGFDVEGNFKALALAKKYDFMYAAIGIHPHWAEEWNKDVAAKILKMAKFEERVVALGEIGLDFFKSPVPRNVQEKAFRGQLQIAKKMDLPVIIHCRDAYDEVYKILDEEDVKRVLMHCFSGNLEQARTAWSRGYYTAFTGVITYPKAEELRKIAAQCPPDRLLIETDCPFLAPQSHRRQRNESAFLRETFDKVVEIRNQDGSFLEQQIENNLKSLFVVK